MFDLVIGSVIVIILLTAEYFLCMKFKSPAWGGVIPLGVLAGTIYVFFFGKIPFELNYVFFCIILNSVFFGEWGRSREKYEKMSGEKFENIGAEDLM